MERSTGNAKYGRSWQNIPLGNQQSFLLLTRVNAPKSQQGSTCSRKTKVDMIIGGILLGLLLVALAWLLWTPLRLEIDSEAGHFQVEWRHLMRVNWLPEEALDCIHVKAPFLNRHFFLSEMPAKREEMPAKTEPQKPHPAKKSRSIKTAWRMGRKILRSFEVKRFQLDWDSDDFIWNARMFPLVFGLSAWKNAQVQINFMGRREIALVLENRLGRILWAVIHTFLTKQ